MCIHTLGGAPNSARGRPGGTYGARGGPASGAVAGAGVVLRHAAFGGVPAGRDGRAALQLRLVGVAAGRSDGARRLRLRPVFRRDDRPLLVTNAAHPARGGVLGVHVPLVARDAPGGAPYNGAYLPAVWAVGALVPVRPRPARRPREFVVGVRNRVVRHMIPANTSQICRRIFSLGITQYCTEYY